MRKTIEQYRNQGETAGRETPCAPSDGRVFWTWQHDLTPSRRAPSLDQESFGLIFADASGLKRVALALQVNYVIIHTMNWFDDVKARMIEWKLQQKSKAAYWDNFTPRVQRTFLLANDEARKMNLDYIGTDHLLLGLIGLGDGMPVTMLKALGLNLEAVRRESIKQNSARAAKISLKYNPLTPRTRKVLNRAKKEAETLGHGYTGTEHLLLALLAEPDGPAWRIFKMAGVNFELTRQQITKEITPIFTPSRAGQN